MTSRRNPTQTQQISSRGVGWLILPLTLLGNLYAVAIFATEPAVERLSYRRDVRPILADKCWHCHGPDEKRRQAELRLDRPDGLTADRKGKRVIVPGQPAASELVRRITAADSDERMPPQDELRQLTPSEIDVLRRWVEQGGEFEQHWSFVSPRRAALPSLHDTDWPRNPIDYFVLDRLEQNNLRPSPPAERASLLRRVSLDLTGLPPTPAEVAAFLLDESPDAYEQLVDRLLSSPQYGERVGLVWLDAARYADSGGYQGDILRSMWIWRDWLIAALNRDLPFDQFTIEQLAGDLLPQATTDQRIATGFHRNHRINDEDGIILEEYRVEYVADRAETTASVWLGLTMGCCRCHDHKYDPVTQREYYQLYTYFNSIAEQGRGHGNAPPLLSIASAAQQQKLTDFASEIAGVQRDLERLKAEDSTTTTQRDELTKRLEKLRKEHEAFSKQIPTTMVLQELDQPRETFVLVRGAYDQPSDKVSHGTPQVLSPPATEFPSNRLGLARWLVDPRNPLTARVTVNRFWQMLFGRGLVETMEDFGTQGQLPTHPELLDWLACEFGGIGESPGRNLDQKPDGNGPDRGAKLPAWEIKRLLRLMVTSATYRQSAYGTAAQFEQDPANQLLARGSRFRLPAELIRDQALAAAGTLVGRIGGPSVRPYQPDGLWKDLVSNDMEYNQGRGADLYRRSLYTFVRRTVPPPAMTALDAPNREICTVRRQRTNTPLQALVVMNDPTYVEAARGIAERVLREAPADPHARLTYTFRLLLAREPSPSELSILSDNLQHFLQRFTADDGAARQLTSVGESPPTEQFRRADLAAFTALANLLLNLDETLTK